MNIYLLSGYIGSGKSTAGVILQGLIPDAITIAFGDAVKDDIARIYKFDRRLCDSQLGKMTTVDTPEGSKTIRQLLISHSAYMKEKHNDPGVWARVVADQMSDSFSWIIHDWRYKIEYDILRERFPDANIYTLRIVRPLVTVLDDPSEHDLDDYNFEYTFQNDGSRAKLREALTQALNL
jgi:hypothetical protein